MAIGSSTSSLQSVTQDAWQQLKLQQAQRDADRAEWNAQALQAQAREAKSVASRAQDVARSLAVKADQAQSEAGKARQGVASLASLGQMQTLLNHVSEQVFPVPQDLQQSVPAAAQASAATTPVVNTQGQITGAVINTTA